MNNDTTNLLDDLAAFGAVWEKRRASGTTSKAVGRAMILIINEIISVNKQDVARCALRLDGQEYKQILQIPMSGQFIVMWQKDSKLWSHTLRWIDGELKEYDVQNQEWVDAGILSNLESTSAVYFK